MDQRNPVCGWPVWLRGVSIDHLNGNLRVDDPPPFDHDRPMGVAAAEAKNRDAAWLWRRGTVPHRGERFQSAG
jgi:hypothetical protein